MEKLDSSATKNAPGIPTKTGKYPLKSRARQQCEPTLKRIRFKNLSKNHTNSQAAARKAWGQCRKTSKAKLTATTTHSEPYSSGNQPSKPDPSKAWPFPRLLPQLRPKAFIVPLGQLKIHAREGTTTPRPHKHDRPAGLIHSWPNFPVTQQEHVPNPLSDQQATAAWRRLQPQRITGRRKTSIQRLSHRLWKLPNQPHAFHSVHIASLHTPDPIQACWPGRSRHFRARSMRTIVSGFGRPAVHPPDSNRSPSRSDARLQALLTGQPPIARSSNLQAIPPHPARLLWPLAHTALESPH